MSSYDCAGDYPAHDVARYKGARWPDWRTPPELFAALHREFGFTVDAAASDANALLPRYWTAETDGLAQSWAGEVVWCNPPYGAETKKWTRKAREEAAKGATAVLLIPASTDTAWWHDDVMQAAEVRFIRGLLSFIRPDGSRGHGGVQGSAVVIFLPGHQGPPRFSSMNRPRGA